MTADTVLLSLIVGALAWSLRTQYSDGKTLTRIDTRVEVVEREVSTLREWRHALATPETARLLAQGLAGMEQASPPPFPERPQRPSGGGDNPPLASPGAFPSTV